MKYLKDRNKFKSTENLNETENVNIHNTLVKKICDIKIPDPEFGDLKLNLFPFENKGGWISLPEGFKMWEKSFNEIVKLIPLQEGCNNHYVTIDSKFFTNDDFLRREGVHADGNFCVDPNFRSLSDNLEKSSWGGASPKPTWGGARINDEFPESDGTDIDIEMKSSWGGASPKPKWGGAKISDYVVKEDNSHVKMDWVLPYKIVIPIGNYISEKKGGILSVSTEVGCQAWSGKFKGEVLSEGSYVNMEDQLTEDKKILFEKDSLYFMTSNTPHETLMINKGTRRTFMRITLNHEYKNESMISKFGN